MTCVYAPRGRAKVSQFCKVRNEAETIGPYPFRKQRTRMTNERHKATVPSVPTGTEGAGRLVMDDMLEFFNISLYKICY